ncbi:MAG: hypothetical protein R3F20_06420 [Planctomycetota bacterium]
MIGPDAEYLEGAHAISGNADAVRERLARALERWEKLREEKKYRNLPVPSVRTAMPPEYADKKLVLRVFLRDLPRGEGDESGRRFTKADLRGMWLDFTKWAWNQNWIAFDDPRAFLPKGKKEQEVDPEVFGRICREVLVDNVRGQAPRWKRPQVKEARLTMKRLPDVDGNHEVEYHGVARMEGEDNSYRPIVHGRATWDPRKKRFLRFELLAIGERAGKWQFNQRARDLGPAPMGIALVFEAPKERD